MESAEWIRRFACLMPHLVSMYATVLNHKRQEGQALGHERNQSLKSASSSISSASSLAFLATFSDVAFDTFRNPARCAGVADEGAVLDDRLEEPPAAALPRFFGAGLELSASAAARPEAVGIGGGAITLLVDFTLDARR